MQKCAYYILTFMFRSRSKVSSPLSQKLQDMYETVRDYQDRAGRTLSTPFIKLPLKSVSCLNPPPKLMVFHFFLSHLSFSLFMFMALSKTN